MVIEAVVGCMDFAMSIYIVKNERNDEVAAFTSPQQANFIADELQSATMQQYRVVEMVVDDRIVSMQ